MASSMVVIVGPDLFDLPAPTYLIVGFPCVGVWL